MFKVSFKNVLLYILLKYLLFFIFAMFMTNNFKLLHFYNLKTGEDWFLYLWLVLFFPVLSMILFSAPIYFSFRLKRIGYFILTISAILVAEYFVYVFFTSEKHVNMKGVYNGVISLLVFYLFFFKQININFKHRK